MVGNMMDLLEVVGVGTRAVRCVVYMVGSPAVQALGIMVMVRREKCTRRAETAWAPGRGSALGCGEAVLVIIQGEWCPY